jgi:hypothetical protein
MKRKQVYYNQDTSKLQEQKAYGLYGATLAGAFTIGKTFLYIGLNVLPNMFNVIDYDTFGNPDTIDIWVYDTIGQGMHDGNLLGTPIEIRIYP